MLKTIMVKAVDLFGAIAASLLLLGFLSPWLAVADSIAHFRLYLASFLMLAVLVHLLRRNWRVAAAGGAVCLLGIIGMAPAIPFWSAPPVVATSSAITLVQLNLSFQNRKPQAVADYVRARNADIVTLQEVTSKTTRVIELLKDDYPTVIRCPFRTSQVGGVAVLSRLPKAPDALQGCSQGRGVAWIRLEIGGRPVSVASLHLHWPYPFGQGAQIDALEKTLRDIPRPVLLAGDFNATPWSHAVARIAEATDSRVLKGLRFSFSVNFRGMPAMLPLPIDHVLLPAEFAVADVQAGPGPGSDHKSIVARFGFAGSGNMKQAQATAATETAH